MLDLHTQGEPIDALTLVEHLKQAGDLDAVGGAAAIELLAGSVPAVGNVRQYARIVRDNAMLRRLLHASYEIQAQVHGHEALPRDLVDMAERIILEVAHEDSRKDFHAIESLLHAELDKLQKLSLEGTPITGTPSGFEDLDNITGGFQPGNLIILAASPAMGKSALMANFAENAALTSDKAVALFSLEMSEGELAQRFIASQASIKGDDLRKGRVPQARWGKILQASSRLAQSKLFIDDSSDLSVLDVRAKARRLAQQNADGLGLILIDYLQLMRAGGSVENRVEQIGQISRGLKTLARELEVPVIALSQLNRGVEQRTDKRPVLSDLRESGCFTGRHAACTCPMPASTGVSMSSSGSRTSASPRSTPRRGSWSRAASRARSAPGTKPVLALRTRLGRELRATANHRFLTVGGWRRLDELAEGDLDRACRARSPGRANATLTDEQLGLLGHLIGDGCTLPRHAIQYTTREPELAEIVARLATAVFGEHITPKVKAERTWHQVYLSATAHLTHGRRNPVAEWLDELGVFGLRSAEKRVPAAVFASPPRASRRSCGTSGRPTVVSGTTRAVRRSITRRVARRSPATCNRSFCVSRSPRRGRASHSAIRPATSSTFGSPARPTCAASPPPSEPRAERRQAALAKIDAALAAAGATHEPRRGPAQCLGFARAARDGRGRGHDASATGRPGNGLLRFHALSQQSRAASAPSAWRP